MDKYRNEIDRLISQSTGEVMLNGSHDHASIIIERMYARADRIVRILTKRFDPRIYCDSRTIDSARKMLGDKSRKIQILIEEPEYIVKVGNAYFDDLSRIGNLEVRTVAPEMREPLSVNFAIMDDRGYRFEKDQTGASAIVAFGEKTITPRLNVLFDRVWAKAERFDQKSGSEESIFA